MPNQQEEIVHEAAKRGIIDLVGVLSSSISLEAKRSRLNRIADDLMFAAKISREKI